jgi:hypothetical protein
METQIFHHAKYNLQKNSLKETKILQDIIIVFQKSSYKNRPITYLGVKIP